MPARVQDILDSLNTLAPFNLAEPWDNIGLLIGNPEQEVTTILAGLDPTNSLVDEAISLGANTVITHHPTIFKPLTAINTSTPEGRLLEKALTHKIAIIGCHTNFDSAENGVSTVLAELLGLETHAPLIPSSHDHSMTVGLGRIGCFKPPISSKAFLNRVLQALQLESVEVIGILPENVTTVAVCGGSGSDLAPQARMLGAEIYLTAEIKHNVAIWAMENHFCMIDGTHYATEKPAISFLLRKLEEVGRSNNWDIRIFETKTEHHPFVRMDRNNQK